MEHYIEVIHIVGTYYTMGWFGLAMLSLLLLIGNNPHLYHLVGTSGWQIHEPLYRSKSHTDYTSRKTMTIFGTAAFENLTEEEKARRRKQWSLINKVLIFSVIICSIIGILVSSD